MKFCQKEQGNAFKADLLLKIGLYVSEELNIT